MKNKTGIISGFLVGFIGFLLGFKFLLLHRIPPEDEVPPGMVLIAAVVNGLLFAFIGAKIQSYLSKNKNSGI